MKRILLIDVERYDAKHQTSNVRELEMLVDSVVSQADSRYSMQYFEDCRCYGLREANVYLVNFLQSAKYDIGTLFALLDKSYTLIGLLS